MVSADYGATALPPPARRPDAGAELGRRAVRRRSRHINGVSESGSVLVAARRGLGVLWPRRDAEQRGGLGLQAAETRILQRFRSHPSSALVVPPAGLLRLAQPPVG